MALVCILAVTFQEAQLFGERVVKRHVEAFNELTRIMTATTRPKGGRKNADVPMSERCLTLAAITELLDGSTPLLQLDDGPSTEGDPVRNDDTRKVLPDLVKRFIYARKQAQKTNEPDLTDSTCNTLPQDSPHKGPSKQPAISRPKTRSQTTAAAKPPHPVLALLNKSRTSCPQKTHSYLHNISAYRNKIKAVSTDPKEVIAALDDDPKIAQTIKEKMAKDGTLLYRVQWQDTLLQKRHVPLLEKYGHCGNYSRVDPKLYGSKVAALYWHVHWQDTWESEEAMHNQPESPDLFKEYLKRAAAHRAEEETRPDLPLSNNERQGHGHKPLYLQTLCLNKQPELANNISINTFATVNPDRDVQGTGSYHIQVNPTNLGLAGIHSPTGAFLGDITMDRLRILELAHKQVGPSDLAGSIAALLSRYKNNLPSEHNA